MEASFVLLYYMRNQVTLCRRQRSAIAGEELPRW
jgi:hypothetical protein